jgi:protein ImuB
VHRGEEVEAARSLPVAALDMDHRITSSLRRLGLGRIEHLLNAPRASLSLRFGAEILRRLDRLTAREPDTLDPVSSPELLFAKIVLAEPIAHSAGVEAALDRLSQELCVRLNAKGLGARILDLRAVRVDGEVSTLRVGTAAPTIDPSHICRLFAESLERLDPGFGIERMALVAPRTEKIALRQRATDDHHTLNLAHLVDKLTARIGESHVFRLVATQQDMPERSFKAAAPLSPRSGELWDRRGRPVQMIAPPQRIDVVALLPDHPPARFTWRGRQHRVSRADGPECIYGEWWQRDEEIALTRDYYRVEDEDGGRYWLFRSRDVREGHSQWYVHGVFG